MLAAIMLAVVLVSCSSNNERKTAAGEIKINLIADKDINPNASGHPAPLSIFIYNIKETDVFSNADFFEITDGSSKPLLAASSKIYEAILQPGEARSIFINLNNDTRTLGFISAYRNLNDSIWLATWDLPKKTSWWEKVFSDDSLELNAHFHKTAMTIKKVD
ncbi:type VI secretion system lipoprotein TssJ [Pantoea sp. FN0302]|uniref:type VI secretion system lipoprotein TssJ n=1 Tax=unclassified Pantoea TaxID=2630326 RepID=UPI003CE70682